MGFFHDIGKAFKGIVHTVSDVANTVVDGVGEVAGWVADKVGDGVEGVTRVVAGDKVADVVKKTFDENIEDGIKRSVKGIASIIATPLTAIDDVVEKGFIDGLTSNTLEGIQDITGGVTRTVAGKQAESSFDTVYDEKIQKPAEIVLSTAARIGLAIVPGGQLILAADAASEFASLGYRAAIGEKLGVGDYVGAGASLLALGGGAVAGSVFKGASGTTQAASTTVAQGTKIGAKAVIQTTDDLVIQSTKVADDLLMQATKISGTAGTKATTEISEETTKAITKQTIKDTAKDEALGQVDEQAQNQLTSYIENKTSAGGIAQPLSNMNSFFQPSIS